MENIEPKHVCGVCNKSFNSVEEYEDHTCTTGYKPKDSEHLIKSTTPGFGEIQKSALERGAKAQEETK